MIEVNVNETPGGRITSFEMSGHADFDEYGKDLVCAAASAVSFGAVNSVFELTGTEPGVEQGEDGGFLAVSFPESEDDDAVQLIMRSMVVSLQTIERDYGEHIRVTINR
ncbi:ribosomal-processing cysteine protease Prp [Edaphobacillus lindanitolerans]|uniref:Ribosomal processing cysteine protease Prp n=1 Tax=Edaphobacillus lindanitolerans TaxID=550447 RepID=A0A1U7PPQ1_9BACI|nr:ribosomal-processing cysteine protease Prp [Edaphobacillus lindanitolerans]SIT83054.1 hypothetical protein SAMN05428946_1575 [Edaphobacillus lindanitolerans]